MASVFQEGQRVRIVRLNDGWHPDNQWVVGEIGTVRGPSHDGDWLVWITGPEGETLLVFEADEIELIAPTATESAG